MKWRALECVLILAILFVLTCLFPGPTGTVHYFSPDSLESKYRPDVWLFGSVLNYLSGLRDKSSPLADHLMKNGYWTPTGATQPRWIVTGHFSAQWKDGQTWLHRVLYWEDEKWIAWTEANPRLARLVWPEFLASVRREESASEAIELLLLANHTASIEEFRQLVQSSEVLGDEVKKSITDATQ